ncbi:hypothetical protein JCM33374_g6564 [Metschnikowia sp. JCM 33374]|nr:hypothetical protein JCM33374_g6564 [Metschnikowia sp. JCM 33374]
MPPKKTSSSRAKGSRKQPTRKKIPSRSNFHDSESDDDTTHSSELKPSLSSSQTLLGPHNSLKQLLAGPASTTKKSPSTPPRKKPRSTKSKIPLSPINSASTPISYLKNATAQLGISNGHRRSPIHFDDIENFLPPQKKQRSDRLNSQPPSSGPHLSPKKKLTSQPPKPRCNASSRKTPKIQEFPVEDDSYMGPSSPQAFDLDDETDVMPTNNRRSSYSNRGKRVSSIGNGFIAKPHQEVSEKDYYKLLDPSMSEPNRMRQLLSWCFRKTIDTEKSKAAKATGDTQTADGISKAIELELLDDLINGSISTSWYSLNDDTANNTMDGGLVPGKTIVLPNPLNESNKESIEVFKNKLQTLRVEKEKLHNAYESNVKDLEGLELNPEAASKDELRAYLRKHQSERSVSETIIDESLTKQMQQNLKKANTTVEQDLKLNVDKLSSLSHRMKQSAGIVSKFGHNIEPEFTNLVHKYITRGRSNTGQKDPTTMELLRGIAKLDCGKKPHK